jgi:hypothetical protein
MRLPRGAAGCQAILPESKACSQAITSRGCETFLALRFASSGQMGAVPDSGAGAACCGTRGAWQGYSSATTTSAMDPNFVCRVDDFSADCHGNNERPVTLMHADSTATT